MTPAVEGAAAIVAGLTLGLSAGAHCFWSCATVLGPFLVATDGTADGARRWSSVGSAMRVLGWYNLGRLLAYLAVGVLVSLLADALLLPPAVQGAALLVSAGLLGYSVARPSTTGCWAGRERRGAAFLLGLLQGLSPCPPFLVAVGLALATPSLARGVLLFLSLFVGTAVYTLPLALLEPLRRRRWLFLLVRGLGAAVCAVLVVQAVLLLVR